MNNPGLDTKIWEQLCQKWTELDAKGYKINVNFNILKDPKDEKNILGIDVIQHIDKKLVTETVQHRVGEAYAALGITDLSMERLIEVYKKILKKLHHDTKPKDFDMDLSVTMTWYSATAGEVEGLLVHPDAPVQSTVLVYYRHYYILNALRDKMIESTGDAWTKVRAEYHAGDVVFYFEYEKN